MTAECSKPMTKLSWDLWCSTHLEPFRAEWPKGAALAMLGLFNAAVRDDAIIEAADHDTYKLTDTLDRFKPVCCHLGDEIMHLVVGYAKEGQVYNGENGPLGKPAVE